MDALMSAPLNACLTKVVLTNGTTTTVSTSNAATYVIKGKIYVQDGAWSNQATPTTDYATGNAFVPIPIPLSSPNLPGVPNGAAGYGCIYLVGTNAAGEDADGSAAVKVIQGSIVALDSSGNFLTAPQFGGLGPVGSASGDNDFCPLGYIIVKLTATAVAAWTFGINNLSSVTGVTYAFGNLSTMPDRPLTA